MLNPGPPCAGWRAVAMAAGSIDPAPADPVKNPPKQVHAPARLRHHCSHAPAMLTKGSESCCGRELLSSQQEGMQASMLSQTVVQVVVVLTASLRVLCFDHNLKLLWDAEVRPACSHVHVSQ